MYSKLYYDEKIKPLVEEVENELSGSMELSKGEKLNLCKRIARDLYEGKDEDVKELVNAKLKERGKVMEDQKNDDIDRMPEQYLCYNVRPEGTNFSQSYPDIQKTYMACFMEYLEKIYSEATCLEHALTQPLESDDLDGDLSLEPNNVDSDENSPDGRSKPVEKADIPQPSTATETTRAPKKKQPEKQSVKQKSGSKTTVEGMYSQYFVSYILLKMGKLPAPKPQLWSLMPCSPPSKSSQLAAAPSDASAPLPVQNNASTQARNPKTSALSLSIPLNQADSR
ncbi:hypothetical protein BYT27DRAFT_7258870 [Phlegmacium glaucopus]|nr:hypothetical protein BYT27DRAFT_7258870 [Phlegmacium glaucopus]